MRQNPAHGRFSDKGRSLSGKAYLAHIRRRDEQRAIRRQMERQVYLARRAQRCQP